MYSEIILTGTKQIDLILFNLRFNHYIPYLKYENFEIKYNYNLDTGIDIDIIIVTEYTKNLMCAFLQLTNEDYRSISFINKQRIKRLFTRHIWISSLLDDAFKEKKFNTTEFNDINLLKNYFKSSELLALEPKYLEVLSILFNINIVLLSTSNTQFFGNIYSSNETIFILNINDDIYLPLLVNKKFVIQPVTNLLYNKIKNNLHKINITNIILTETEDNPDNFDMILNQKFFIFEETLGYDDFLEQQDREGQILKFFEYSNIEQEKKELDEEKKKLEQDKEQFNKEKELLSQIVSQHLNITH